MSIWRWVGIVLAVLATLVLGFVGWVYLASDMHIRSFPKPPPFAYPIPTNADVADIIAYLRSAPVVGKELPKPRKPFMIRMAVALGQDDVVAGFLDQLPPLRSAPDDDSPIARGEYIAMTACAECHGFDLHGNFPWGEGSPNLVIIQAYDFDAFHTLMTTGTA